MYIHAESKLCFSGDVIAMRLLFHGWPWSSSYTIHQLILSAQALDHPASKVGYNKSRDAGVEFGFGRAHVPPASLFRMTVYVERQGPLKVARPAGCGSSQPFEHEWETQANVNISITQFQNNMGTGWLVAKRPHHGKRIKPVRERQLHLPYSNLVFDPLRILMQACQLSG